MYKLTVHGLPAPKGSMKCIGARGHIKHQLIEDDKTGARKTWRDQVTAAGRVLRSHIGHTITGPFGIAALFTVERPTTAARRLLPSTRSAGDIDKLLRMILDGLDDADVFSDDSRCVITLPGKVFPAPGRPPGVQIWIWEHNPRQLRRAVGHFLEAGGEFL